MRYELSSPVEGVLQIRRFTIPDSPTNCFIVKTHYHWDHIWGNGSLPAFDIIGHSPCGISLFLHESRTLIAGDNIGDNQEAILPELENDAQTYRKAIDAYQDLQPGLILSGHVVPVDAGFLDKIRSALG